MTRDLSKSRPALGAVAVLATLLGAAAPGTGARDTAYRLADQTNPIAATPDADATTDPRPHVDLSDWKLTLPLPKTDGDTSGTASKDNPTAGAPPFLIIADDGLHFWAPVAGATTPHSMHARSELVSHTTWSAGGAGEQTLRVSASIQRLPDEKPDVIIGQIHGADDISSSAWVMLHYTDGAIRVVVKKGLTGSASDKFPLISGVPMNTPFEFTITDTGAGTVTCTASYAGQTRSAEIPITSAWAGQTVRFQAGDYQQANSPGATTAAVKADDTADDSADDTADDPAGGTDDGGGTDGKGGQDGARLTFQELSHTATETD